MANQIEKNILLTTTQMPQVTIMSEKVINYVGDNDPSQELAKQPMLIINEDDIENVSTTSSDVPSVMWPQVLASLSVSLGSMIVGFTSAYTSPALESMNQPGSSLNVTVHEASWIAGLLPLSALVGGIIGGILIEKLGRRNTILGTAIPFVFAWALIAFAQNVGMLYAGRSVAGFCVGVNSLSLPVYIGETIQPQVRGTLGLLPTTFGNIGILICYTAGMFINWSYLAILGGLLSFPFLLCMCLIPETPRWYVSKNKHKKGREALQWLRGKDSDISPEFTSIEKAHIASERHHLKLSDLVSTAYMKPLLISLGLMLFQQLSGINVVIFYTVYIFNAAGSTIDSNLCTIIVGIVNFFSIFVAIFLIDRLGRKALLYISDVFMILSLGILGGFFYYKDTVDEHITDEYGWLPLVCTMAYVIAFSLGWGPIPWLMMGEIFPGKIRGAAAAIATAFNWMCTFIVTTFFGDLERVLGMFGAFWLFAVICVIGLIFVILFVPETRGRSLEDIEKRLTGPVRRIPSAANLKPLPMSM